MSSPPGALVCLVLASAVALTGCSTDEAPAPSTSASSPSTSSATARTEPVDTYTDSPVPATVEVPVDDLPGFEAISFWEGTEVVDAIEKVATGRNILTPSDDPVGAARALNVS